MANHFVKPKTRFVKGRGPFFSENGRPMQSRRQGIEALRRTQGDRNFWIVETRVFENFS